MVQQLDRRTFMTGLAATGMRSALGQSTGAVKLKNIGGIQIGAVSFLDEGTERVLDILQERARGLDLSHGLGQAEALRLLAADRETGMAAARLHR